MSEQNETPAADVPVLSLRDRFLSRTRVPREVVRDDAWGGDEIEIRGLTAGQQVKMVNQASDAEGQVDNALLAFSLVLQCAHDPATGERLFQSDDLAALQGTDSRAFNALWVVAARLSGLAVGDASGKA